MRPAVAARYGSFPVPFTGPRHRDRPGANAPTRTKEAATATSTPTMMKGFLMGTARFVYELINGTKATHPAGGAAGGGGDAWWPLFRYRMRHRMPLTPLILIRLTAAIRRAMPMAPAEEPAVVRQDREASLLTIVEGLVEGSGRVGNLLQCGG
jgi:hypothetical protein